MPTVIMPKMGDAMEEGTLLKWLKEQGDEVAEGDPLAEIETDKVTLEINAEFSGTLTQRMANEGDSVAVGAPIATIGAPDEVAAAPAKAVAAPPSQPSQPAQTNGQPPAGSNGATARTEPARAPGERLRASPLVKRLAAEHGIDLSGIPGTGPGGRIVKDDIMPYVTGAKQAPAAVTAPAAPAAPAAPQEAAPVAAAPAAPSAPAPVAAGPSGRPAGIPKEMSRIRRTTGKRMAESKLTAPHFYVSADIDMAAAVAFREQVNAQIEDDAGKVTFNDMVVKACALALREFPNLNASLDGDQLHDHPNIDVNIAVAIEGGLIAPFIPDADQKSLGSIARMAKDLIGRARSGGLQPHEYQGGTFTVSNLGMYQVDEFIAVINPPQAAILAVGSIADVPVVKDGEIVPGKRMKITLSADHRITDGAEVARCLLAIRRYLENPMLLAIG
jgi:pyruvate dehydrogenase E2 component (dihydrolipoamide acetyltransferase)